MNRVVLLGVAVFATATFAAEAEEPPMTAQRSVPAIGQGTDALLSLQREGRRAGEPAAIPAAEAAPAQARYFESFKRPIPDRLLSQGAYAETK